MAQAQNIVDVELKDGSRSRGIATGNNAAWMCPCGRKEPLLGRTRLVGGASDGSHVVCPDCRRKYLVVANAKDYAVVLKVVEVRDAER